MSPVLGHDPTHQATGQSPVDPTACALEVTMLTTVHPYGDPRIFSKIGRSLVDAGYSVRFVMSGGNPTEFEGSPVENLPTPRYRLDRMVRIQFVAARRLLARDPGICHFHDPELLPLAVLLSWAGWRVIYDVHEEYSKALLDRSWIPGWLSKLVARLVGRLERWAATRFHLVVAATPEIAEQFPAARVVVVQNFPDVEREFPRAATAPASSPLAVYVGSITESRGIPEILEALRLLPEKSHVRCLLGGPINSVELKSELTSATSQERWRWLGPLNRAGVANLLSQSLVGLVVLRAKPNYVNAWPTKLFEYMAAGIPVIASDLPRTRRIVEESGCGRIVNTEDPAAIAEALEWFETHPLEAHEMGRRGRAAIERTFNWHQERDRLLQSYREACGAPVAGGVPAARLSV
jgi:glycosyltransferase involved in cell wall biosynthesis